MSWFNPKGPKTGTGKSEPASRSLPPKPKLVFRTPDGKKVKPTKKGK